MILWSRNLSYQLVLTVTALFVLVGSTAVGQGQAETSLAPADEAVLRELIPHADHFRLVEKGLRHFRAYAEPVPSGESQLVGLAFFTTDLTPRIYAYKGRITTLVGVDTGGILIGIRVIHHYEPFGYFSIDRPAFPRQFVGKSILDPFEVGEDIDAVSRATITVDAATRAIRQGARQLVRDFVSAKATDP